MILGTNNKRIRSKRFNENWLSFQYGTETFPFCNLSLSNRLMNSLPVTLVEVVPLPALWCTESLGMLFEPEITICFGRGFNLLLREVCFDRLSSSLTLRWLGINTSYETTTKNPIRGLRGIIQYKSQLW